MQSGCRRGRQISFGNAYGLRKRAPIAGRRSILQVWCGRAASTLMGVNARALEKLDRISCNLSPYRF
jgi:hypothetical protein